MKSYGKLVAIIVATWFVFALSGSAMGLFKNTANRVGLAVALGASVPILAFGLWYATSEGLRKFVLELDPRTLTAAQTLRAVGVVFVVLEAHNALPALFALPAGYGDIFIGVTASLAAWKLGEPRHRNSFILWQVLGIADLVTAVGVGVTAGLIHPEGPTMALMTELPLSLIPTFFVPLFLVLHVIVIAQAKRWKLQERRNSTAAPSQPVFAR